MKHIQKIAYAIAFISCACANAVIPEDARRLPTDREELKARLLVLNHNWMTYFTNLVTWNRAMDQNIIDAFNDANNHFTTNILYYGPVPWDKEEGESLHIVYGVYVHLQPNPPQHPDEEGMIIGAGGNDTQEEVSRWSQAIFDRQHPEKLFSAEDIIVGKKNESKHENQKKVSPVGPEIENELLKTRQYKQEEPFQSTGSAA